MEAHSLHDTYFHARLMHNIKKGECFLAEALNTIDNNDNWSYVGILNIFQKVIKTYF